MDQFKVDEYYKTIQKAIDEVGYAIQGVFGGELPVCYTVGLTPLIGAEVIATAPISLNTLYMMVRSIVDELIENKEQLSTKEFIGGTLLNGDDLRCSFVDVSNNEAVKNFINVKVNAVDKVFQLYMGDQSNLLPGEDGYNEKFDQVVK